MACKVIFVTDLDEYGFVGVVFPVDRVSEAIYFEFAGHDVVGRFVTFHKGVELVRSRIK